MMQNNGKHYVDITETPDIKGSVEQITRLYTRYKFASGFCKNKDVLEVACGAGIGLGYLARYAKRVVGGDIDDNNLKFATKIYKRRHNIELQPFDAHNLPFNDKSFDVVILYEAMYYLSAPEKFIAEAHRVLRDKGVIITCTANKDWSGFNPSPYSVKYFSAPELYRILSQYGFTNIALFGDSPVKTDTVKDKCLSAIIRTAAAFHCIPGTMKGKEILKRIFFGKLTPLPQEVEDGMSEYTAPVPIPYNFPNREYKVIYALGFK